VTGAEATAVAEQQPSNGSALIDIEHLKVFFPIKQGFIVDREVARVHAVNDVTLSIAEGETVGLVGESGCGKSTAGRTLLRLLEPTGGTIEFAGQDITNIGGNELRRLRRQMQMVFQDPYGSLNPRQTIGSIIAAPFDIQGIKPEGGTRKTVQGLMERVGLNPEHYNRYPHEFSGGQRQRIGVARALALKPKVIVADEPVSALDVSIQAQILTLLRELRRELGLTLVLIAHDLAVVRHMCDRVAVMHDGRLVEVAPVEELYRAPREDYTRALLAAVPRIPGPALGEAGGPQSSPSSST
jgi:peptide/nickel transport system ATP-binding protein